VDVDERCISYLSVPQLDRLRCRNLVDDETAVDVDVDFGLVEHNSGCTAIIMYVSNFRVQHCPEFYENFEMFFRILNYFMKNVDITYGPLMQSIL
jgi:hypothetical protein